MTLLTVKEAAEELKVSPSTIRDMCERGDLVWVPVGKGQERKTRRIVASSIQEYIQREANARTIPFPADGPLNEDGFDLLREFGCKRV